MVAVPGAAKKGKRGGGIREVTVIPSMKQRGSLWSHPHSGWTLSPGLAPAGRFRKTSGRRA